MTQKALRTAKRIKREEEAEKLKLDLNYIKKINRK